jgi:methenyltetrahydrofolate cyclohydrolase
MIDSHATIEAFLTATASRTPTPGGGSVAALTGALAAALGEMVLSYSVGKKELADHDAELKAALAEFTTARRLLVGLMVEDQAAYAALSAARKTPKSAEFTAALEACLSAPQAVAATGVALLDLCDRLAPKVNPHLLSDLSICVDLSMAVVRASQHNIRVNLTEVADPARRAAIEQSSKKVLIHAIEIVQRFSRRMP